MSCSARTNLQLYTLLFNRLSCAATTGSDGKYVTAHVRVSTYNKCYILETRAAENKNVKKNEFDGNKPYSIKLRAFGEKLPEPVPNVSRKT